MRTEKVRMATVLSHVKAKNLLVADIIAPTEYDTDIYYKNNSDTNYDNNSKVFYDKSGNVIPPGEYPFEPEPPEHDFIQYPQSRVLVAPKYKLAFCYVEKNACLSFNYLFNSLNGIQEYEDVLQTWWKSNAANQNISLDELTTANGWKWGVFLRDPAKRYLSAWGSKCLKKEENGWNCRPDAKALLDDTSSVNLQVSSFEEATRRNHEFQSRLFENPHWAKQSQFCQGFHDLSRFDFVGLLNNDMNSQVRRMLHKAHISDRDYLVDKYFPLERIHGHSSNLNESLFFRSAETIRLVHDIYREDYEMIDSKCADSESRSGNAPCD